MGVDWFENVGTPSYRVSRLHEHAVAVLWDELQSGMASKKPVRVRTFSGGISENLLEGVTRIGIPTDKTPIIGKIPDLALFDERDNPVRVVEITTKNRDPKKEEHFRKAQIDFIEVAVRNEEELTNFCWITPYVPQFRSEIGKRRPFTRAYHQQLVKEADYSKEVERLCEAILNCPPEVRRQLAAIMKELESHQSLLNPISPNNPKWEVLMGNQKTE